MEGRKDYGSPKGKRKTNRVDKAESCFKSGRDNQEEIRKVAEERLCRFYHTPQEEEWSEKYLAKLQELEEKAASYVARRKLGEEAEEFFED